MFRSFRILFFFFIFIAFISIPNSHGETIIRDDRPRLLFNKSDVERIRATIATYNLNDFKALSNYAKRRLNDPENAILKGDYPSGIVMPVAFAGLISGNNEFIQKAVNYAVLLANVPANNGNDTVQRERLLSMSCVYDWLYDYLSSSQKSIIKNSIISHINHLKYFLDKPLFTGGHSRYGSVVIMAGLIAVYGEYGDFDGQDLLGKVKDNWVNGYNPFQSYVAKDGGYHMGWRYGPAYTAPFPYLLWEKATGTRWGEEWRKEQAYWFIYGLRGDGTLPRSGDCWNSVLADKNITKLIAICAGLFKDPYAEWFYRKYFSDTWAPYRLFRIAFRDHEVHPTPPFDQENPLPLSRHFANSGFVISRDSWGKNSSHLVFKSSPFYTKNHHHKDQNHFELSYKGSLLIDSGFYDSYGTSHWENYYTRTIAHNTLVVFDPDERFNLYGENISNDGGQFFPNYLQEPKGHEPKNLQETLLDKYKFDGIVGFSSTNESSWVRGDASKAYQPNKVKSYIRDVMMVNKPLDRNHPLILVLDRIELNKLLTPTILFHSNEKPVTSGNYFKIQNLNGGVLHAEVFSSEDIKLNLIGGKGKEWFVDGVNHPPNKSWEKPGIDAGAWRVEVSKPGKTDSSQFITLLSIDDVSNSQGKPLAQPVIGTGYSGIITGKNLLLIKHGEPTSTKWIFTGNAYDHVEKIYIAGVEPNKEHTFKINDSTYKSTSQVGGVIILTIITPPRDFKVIRVE